MHNKINMTSIAQNQVVSFQIYIFKKANKIQIPKLYLTKIESNKIFSPNTT